MQDSIDVKVHPLAQPGGGSEPWRVLRWSIPSHSQQVAVHLVWRSGTGEVLHEVRDASSTPWALDEYPAAVAVQARVLLADENGAEQWSAWSPLTQTGTAPRELGVSALTGPAGASASCGVEYFRTSFMLDAVPDRAELCFAIWGVGTVLVNGAPADDEVLFPGWTDYRFRQRVASVDVAHLLRVGENVVAVEVADGWFRGRLGAVGDTSIYGDQRRILAQLDLLDAPRTLLEGEWRWFGAAHRSASLYDGSTIDLAGEPEGWKLFGFDDSGWTPAIPVPYEGSNLVPRDAPGVRIVASGAATRTSPGSSVYDGGVNRSGVVRVTGSGRRGDRIAVQHAEILTAQGQLETASNRGAECRDEYVLAADGPFELQPSHTYRGFRYVSVTGAEIESVEWIEYSSAGPAATTFRSSSSAMRAMHQTSVQTVRSNLVSIPTDCPQRDERLGWTGDAQLVVASAQRLFPLRSFWSSWMRDLISATNAAGAVPPLIPDIVCGRGLPLGPGVEVDMYDRAGWADALVEVPYQLWRATGDRRPLIEALPCIREWLTRCLDQRGADGLVRRPFEFGDWLDPTAPPGRPWEGALSAHVVANAYLVRSLRRAAEIEEALGGSSAQWLAGAQQLRLALRPLIEGALHSQGGCAMTLAFDLCDPDERGAVTERLVGHVRAARWRLSTGFLTTPLLLEALTAAGRAADAVRVALNTSSPSWLAQLNRGATTWWERWDALTAEGTVGDGSLDGSPEGMISFNHLAMASVADWLHTRVAGVDVDFTSLPFARFRPLVSTETASGGLRQGTPLGALDVEWHLTSPRDLAARFSVPEGMTLRLELPRTAASALYVDGRLCDHEAPLEAGTHELLLTRPTVVHVAPPTM